MMSEKNSLVLGDHFETFIKQKVSSGKYDSPEEVVRAALRLLEDEEGKRELISQALKDGEKSGHVTNFDPDTHLSRLHENHS